MPMKTRVLEETKADFEKELQAYEEEGWIPQWATKNTIVFVDDPEEELTEIIHTIVLQKWEDD
ncbi:MAG: hypothetical protein ABFC12_05950 [Methanobacterium sp.]